MHQVRKDSDLLQASPVSLLLILANSLDCRGLTTLFSMHQRVEVLEASADADFSFARCHRLSPQLLVVDPKVSSDVIDRAAEMVRSSYTQHVIVLDDRVHEGRLAAVLKLPAVSYFTRHTSFEDLLNATLEIADRGERMFDIDVAHRIRRTPQGLQLDQPPGQPSIARLTERELQVMGLLAQGRSVRDCAEHLQLAESTIDNHKSRMMKKLHIHKAAEITHVAIRDGVILV
ncbi:MAG: response regulator transcription factor [Pirellulales bacterium]|nr:response regulator transcription factor [Pirellulales bacterium]